jgi:DNA-binding NarL/FixJ family response regulator
MATTATTRPLGRSRILVGHAVPLFSMGIFATLAENPGYEVRRTVGLTSPKVISDFAPHFICTDFRNGMGLLGDNTLRQGARLAIFTRVQDPQCVSGALRAGVAGYVLMNSSLEQVGQCIEAIRLGLRFISPCMLDRLKQSSPVPLDLSPRQKDVLRLMRTGMPNKQIASALGVAEATVKTHVAVVMGKLGATNRTHAIARATELGAFDETIGSRVEAADWIGDLPNFDRIPASDVSTHESGAGSSSQRSTAAILSG